MSTKSSFHWSEISSENRAFTQCRTTIETAFYGNNVSRVESLEKAYDMAKNSPGTIVTDMNVFEPEKIGIPKDAKVLLFNDGETTGRFAGARVIQGDEGVAEADYGKVIREAVYTARYKKLYHSEAYIGLDRDFMIKAHLLIPENHENILYNWLLNFQYRTKAYDDLYESSPVVGGDEPDLYVFSDPDWKHPDFPDGLAYFDTEHNCACLLGLRYFGEHKKGTLTIAWALANRNGYASCHGGMKRVVREDGRHHVMGVFGLSGSGKSTLTHAAHGQKYDVTVLHDDAYIISVKDGSSVALEPSYFDKTQDYPMTSPDNKYLVTVQNCGATLDKDGRVVIVTEDIRNGNGRAIKSKLWSENRVDKLEEPISSIVWLMKDPSLPPVLKLNNPVLASVMGAVLATKRTSAEKLRAEADRDALVFEPYANPFRTYPLAWDYHKFKTLFARNGVDCYIINTGHFLNKKISKETTLSIIEKIIDEEAKFIPYGNLSDMETLEIEGYECDFTNPAYTRMVKKSFENRERYLFSLKERQNGKDELPQEALAEISQKIAEAHSTLSQDTKIAAIY